MTAGPDMLGIAVAERFLEHGAELMVADDGRVVAWFPEPGNGRRPRQPDDWTRGFTDGALRELWWLMKAVPAAEDAVRDYVRLYPRTRCDCGLLA